MAVVIEVRRFGAGRVGATVSVQVLNGNFSSGDVLKAERYVGRGFNVPEELGDKLIEFLTEAE